MSNCTSKYLSAHLNQIKQTLSSIDIFSGKNWQRNKQCFKLAVHAFFSKSSKIGANHFTQMVHDPEDIPLAEFKIQKTLNELKK